MESVKRGRGRPPAENPRSERLGVRLSALESELIAAAAATAAMDTSAWVRETILEAARSPRD